MSYHEWSNLVWGVRISTGDETCDSDLRQVIDEIECGGCSGFPESFYDSEGDLLSRYSFLNNCDSATVAMMKLYGDRIATSKPYIFDLLKLGATVFVVPDDASDECGEILLGFGMCELPFPEGTKHFPERFLQEVQHITWVMGG